MKSNDFMGRGGATERGSLWDILSRREHSEVCADESRSSAAHCGGYFYGRETSRRKGGYMQFFSSAITTLQTLVVALGAGLGVWGVVNLLEGYGSDNPGSNAHVR